MSLVSSGFAYNCQAVRSGGMDSANLPWRRYIQEIASNGVQHLAGREGVIVLGVNEQDRLRDVVNGRWELCSQLRRTIELYPAPEKTTIQVFLAKSKAAECAKTTLRESHPTVR
jgi:hypothetical protein